MLHKKPYTIVGYDKDSDVYVRLATVYMELQPAIQISDYISTLNMRRKTNDEPFDWIEVITEYQDICHHVSPCK